jgi:hypothetical protein
MRTATKDSEKLFTLPHAEDFSGTEGSFAKDGSPLDQLFAWTMESGQTPLKRSRLL